MVDMWVGALIEKEKYYFGEIKRIMREAMEAGLLEQRHRGSLGS